SCWKGCARTYTVKHLNSRRSRSFRTELLMCFCLALTSVAAQPKSLLIDQVVAVVGNQPILHSDLVARAEQLRQNGQRVTPDAVCNQLEDLLYEKLLLEQARLDSVFVDEAQVDGELDRRIRYFASQLGGDAELEKFYGKSVAEIKADFREQVREQLLVQDMQQRITGNIRVTPRDVRQF